MATGFDYVDRDLYSNVPEYSCTMNRGGPDTVSVTTPDDLKSSNVSEVIPQINVKIKHETSAAVAS